MINKDERLCRDCKWCKEPGEFAKCYHPKNTRNISAKYTGFTERVSLNINYCSTHREAGWIHCRMAGSCGKEGRWWEAK